ncbi:unnamed protein product [Lactuca saligna]|uniref:Uncharacterized protein n=1 Tax=Lactuca saligna TaxID=75948 RepID=A0AA35UQY0_LACSI|nr:unnamed protein product [Lactuca saligna]
MATLMPTDAPRVHIGVQGGEKINVVMGTGSKPDMGGSGSSKVDDDAKPPPSTEEMKNKGKGVSLEPTVEEKNNVVEKEIEKQRKIQSILRQRANNPPGIDKGDTSKHFSYEYIEAQVLTGEMHDFEKIPKKSYPIENSDFPINKMMFMA